MQLCVFEDDLIDHLLPIVHTRAVYDVRIGMRSQLTAIRDAFERPPTVLHARRIVAGITALENDLPVNQVAGGANVLFVNGRWIPEEGEQLNRIRRTTQGSEPRLFLSGDEVVAAWVPNARANLARGDALGEETFEGILREDLGEVRFIRRLWDLQNELEAAIRRDFALLTKGLYIYERPGVIVQEGAILAASEQIYIGSGSVVRPGAILNAEYGPIYIGENVEIKEAGIIKGPAFVGSKSVIMTDADIECCSFGHLCKVGGQVEETIFDSLSNKAHSGFLGNAYIGRWCNLGADTNNSNLKNDYGKVKMYDAVAGDFEASGRQFLGLVMGDHSKTGINTMFNTGTVVGVFCNLFGAGFMPRFIPCFSWGGAGEFQEYRLDKALRVAEAVMARRDRSLSDAERENLTAVFDATREEEMMN
ncbi:MAG: putative sugar nucleotidyl transferase [Rhodothermales bacterium]